MTGSVIAKTRRQYLEVLRDDGSAVRLEGRGVAAGGHPHVLQHPLEQDLRAAEGQVRRPIKVKVGNPWG